MFFCSKRRRIIRKAVLKTVKAFDGSKPRIAEHLFYGAVDLDPRNLVVWYLFETDADLENARACGLCEDITKATVRNLLSLGYPAEGFEFGHLDIPVEKIVVEGVSEEEAALFLQRMANRKAEVCFTTKEDIDKKANGDYHLYFQ